MPAWLTVLKMVPWSAVIANAPHVVEGARKLWSAVAGKGAAARHAGGPGATSGAQQEDALGARTLALEAALDELHSQMLTSTELIKSLAEQNAGLIASIEAGRSRLRWLSVATALSLLGLLVLALRV